MVTISSFVGFQVDIYLLNVNNRNTRTRCEIYSKLTTKTPERRQRRSDVFVVVNFEHNSHTVLVFLLLTLSMTLKSSVYLFYFRVLIFRDGQIFLTELAFHRCSWENVFWKYAGILQENTHAEERFQ